MTFPIANPKNPSPPFYRQHEPISQFRGRKVQTNLPPHLTERVQRAAWKEGSPTTMPYSENMDSPPEIFFNNHSSQRHTQTPQQRKERQLALGYLTLGGFYSLLAILSLPNHRQELKVLDPPNPSESTTKQRWDETQSLWRRTIHCFDDPEIFESRRIFDNPGPIIQSVINASLKSEEPKKMGDGRLPYIIAPNGEAAIDWQKVEIPEWGKTQENLTKSLIDGAFHAFFHNGKMSAILLRPSEMPIPPEGL